MPTFACVYFANKIVDFPFRKTGTNKLELNLKQQARNYSVKIITIFERSIIKKSKARKSTQKTVTCAYSKPNVAMSSRKSFCDVGYIVTLIMFQGYMFFLLKFRKFKKLCTTLETRILTCILACLQFGPFQTVD